METTKIPVSQTVGEIQKILGEYGASAILIEYECGEPSALLFEIKLEGAIPSFKLPCHWKPIEEHLNQKHKPKEYMWGERLITRNNKDQAKKVAWRQILRWVEAQMALIETKMVKMQQVFLPYLQTGNNQTLYEVIEERKFKAIEWKK